MLVGKNPPFLLHRGFFLCLNWGCARNGADANELFHGSHHGQAQKVAKTEMFSRKYVFPALVYLLCYKEHIAKALGTFDGQILRNNTNLIRLV